MPSKKVLQAQLDEAFKYIGELEDRIVSLETHIGVEYVEVGSQHIPIGEEDK